MTRPKRFSGWCLLAGALLLFGVGCDNGGSKRASQAQRLSGVWETYEGVSVGATRYGVEVRLEIDEGTGDKGYWMRRVWRGDTTIVEGQVAVVAPNTLQMGGPFSPSLLWTFDFNKPTEISGDMRLTLRPDRVGSVREFLDFLGVGGGAERVWMNLRRPS